MIGRVLGLLALGASVGLVEPGPAVGTSTALEPADAAAALHAPDARLHAAIEAALQAHVPGVAGRDWVLHDLERTDAGPGEPVFIVATGALATPGAPETQVRLTGRFDPAAGELRRVAYRLQPSATDEHREPPASEPHWNVQAAVNHAFTQVLPDEQVAFALGSAESTRVQGGGRRFDGSGIGTWNDADARFVAFTLTLSATGELVAFDYSTAQQMNQVHLSDAAAPAGLALSTDK